MRTFFPLQNQKLPFWGNDLLVAVSKNENIFSPQKKSITAASQSLSCAAGKSLGDFFERNDVLKKLDSGVDILIIDG